MYSVIMFFLTAVLAAVGVAVYRGKTSLIHSYHQTKVENRSAYGKAFGKALLFMATASLLSGGICLIGDSEKTAVLAAGIFVCGSCAGVLAIVAIQRKYNKGVF